MRTRLPLAATVARSSSTPRFSAGQIGLGIPGAGLENLRLPE